MILLLAGVLALLGLPWLSAAGVARRWVELTIITCNDDWASAGSNLNELLAHGFDLLFIQEGKRAAYRTVRDQASGKRLLPFATYGVHQDTLSLAKAGSVVVWSHGTVNRTGAGWTFGAKVPGLLARWIAWLRATVGPGRGRKIWPASVHRPPVRDRRWWKPFDLAVVARVHQAIAAGRLPIIGMDSNEHGGPSPLTRRLTRLRWHAVGNSIDGFLLHRSIQVLSIEELPKSTSDHHPVVARIRVPLGRSAAWIPTPGRLAHYILARDEHWHYVPGRLLRWAFDCLFAHGDAAPTVSGSLKVRVLYSHPLIEVNPKPKTWASGTSTWLTW